MLSESVAWLSLAQKGQAETQVHESDQLYWKSSSARLTMLQLGLLTEAMFGKREYDVVEAYGKGWDDKGCFQCIKRGIQDFSACCHVNAGWYSRRRCWPWLETDLSSVLFVFALLHICALCSAIQQLRALFTQTAPQQPYIPTVQVWHDTMIVSFWAWKAGMYYCHWMLSCWTQKPGISLPRRIGWSRSCQSTCLTLPWLCAYCNLHVRNKESSRRPLILASISKGA